MASSSRQTWMVLNPESDNVAIALHPFETGETNEIYSDWADNDSLKHYWWSIDLDVQPAFHGSKQSE